MWMQGGEGEGLMNSEISNDIYTLPCVEQIASGNLLYITGSSAWFSVVPRLCVVGFEREVQEGENICVHITDSLRCIAETNTVTQYCKVAILRFFFLKESQKKSPDIRFLIFPFLSVNKDVFKKW